MWGVSEEPPGAVEGESSEPVVNAKEKCEQNKSQLESLKELMLKNKHSLEKKEEELQEYSRRLSKIKSRAKLSRRSKEGNVSSKDVSYTSESTLPDALEENIDDISQAKTAKAKSTLLQKKLAENRRAFEQRSKEISETKRAMEEKVEAIRQQLEEQDVAAMDFHKDQLSVTPIKPVMITYDVMSPIQIEDIQEKEQKIVELNNKVLDLEATILDLQENLKEKDSVIESKTKAVTLMSADLSKKGKTTLDTLEDTKDEMRTMQEHFVLLETSLKNKNESLLTQLQERDDKITELEGSINRFEKQINDQKLAELASADFSRSTLDTLVETKEAMKSMQENFVLMESSLKTKNENLLQQLTDYELKLAEANERIFKLEFGIGIVRDPSVEDLQLKLEKVERSNKQLQDDKFELQKNVAELQDKIVNISMHGNGAVIEKDNRIVELENLVEELKQSNKLLEEESKAELQNQVADLSLKNEELSNKIIDLENMVHNLEEQKNEIAARLPEEGTVKENGKVAKLTKELEDLNKSMIKIKAQHKNKLKSLQKQLENFKKVSDTNAELVRLGNQVTLLEEEKGNLQLSLVDFDELKASAGDWQERVADLESKVSAQTKEIEMQIEAIATLENQKLDLMQELHMAKQEISSLEAENAESENLRVTAEMKVVDMEEQLEALQKLEEDKKLESSSAGNSAELVKQLESLTQENAELYNRISKLEEKGASDTGSTESFEAIQDLDKTDLLKRIEDLTQKNNELVLQVGKMQGSRDSEVGVTELVSDREPNELLKKIDQLTQENTDSTLKLSRAEEKGSSDTGSTESFERIPEHNESMAKIELLTQENSELMIKFTKLEEQLENIESKSDVDSKLKVESLLQENENQSVELANLRIQITNLLDENDKLQKQIEYISADNANLSCVSDKLNEKEATTRSEISKREVDFKEKINVLMEEKNLLEKEFKELRNFLGLTHDTTQDFQINDIRIRMENVLKENEEIAAKILEFKILNKKLNENLAEITQEKEELHTKLNQILNDSVDNDKQKLVEKLEILNYQKERATQEKHDLQEQINNLLQKQNQKALDESVSIKTDYMTVDFLEKEVEQFKILIAEQTSQIEEMKNKLASKEEELEKKSQQIVEYERAGKKTESLENELKEMSNIIEEWKFKCNEMQEKMVILEAAKASIEEGFQILQRENEILLEEKKERDAEAISTKQQWQDITTKLEAKLEEQLAVVSQKENEITTLKAIMQEKDQELHGKYVELQNKMIAIDSLQNELMNCKSLIQQKEELLTSLATEIGDLNAAMKTKEEEIYSFKKEIKELNDKVQNSKPLKDYNDILGQLKDKDMILDELQCKINATTKENSNLSEKIRNLLQQNNEIQNQLLEKQRELDDLVIMKEHLEVQALEASNVKSEAEKRVWELQATIDNNAKFADDLRTELHNSYKQMEQLNAKHIEDTQLLNQKLENIIEELNAKVQECEMLRGELEEKAKLVGQNITEETKLALEARIVELEQKLKESEEKIHMQLEKMKKIAANLKKKSAMCQELESRVAELEEKWTTEKDEKEAKNKQIQDVEIAIREKDNRIADLEEKLVHSRNESVEAAKNIDRLSHDLANSKEKISLLAEQLTEMTDEITKLRTNLESSTAELESESNIKQNIILEYNAYKQQIVEENEFKQVELDEMKETARELSVRMQVMEAEYVEQLTLINNLKTENGLLLSKQAQINEKLENVEKESEKRKLLIEQMEKAAVSTSTVTTQTSEEEVTEDDVKVVEGQRCSDCEQCQTLVQALEAKLQEREAEIENLDNELANSIGNFVQMRESLRFNDLMNQTSMRNRSVEDPSNDLLFQYNSLVSNHAELKLKLEEALKENKNLIDKIEELQSLNITLEEKVVITEHSLEDNKQNVEKLQHVDLLNIELSKKCKEHEAELLNMQQQMQTIQEHADQVQQQLQSQIMSLKSVEAQKVEAENIFEDTKLKLEQEIQSLRIDKEANEKQLEKLIAELEMYKNQNVESMDKPMIVKKEAYVFENVQEDNVPQLFDATKIFGVPSDVDSGLQRNKEVDHVKTLLDEKEAQCSSLTQEINHLQKLLIAERSEISQKYTERVQEFEISQKQLHMAQTNLERLEQLLIEKDKEIDLLNEEVRNLTLQITQQQNDTHKTKDNEMEELKMSLGSIKEALDKTVNERDQQNILLESYKLQINNLETELKNSTDSEVIQDLESRVSILTKERDLLQLQVNDLSRTMEELKDSSNLKRNLQMEVEKAVRERDEAKELVTNLTRALEESYKQTDKMPIVIDTSMKESTALEESTIDSQGVQEATKHVTEGALETVSLDVEGAWDSGSTEKLNVDDEAWGWNTEDVQLVGEQQHPISLVHSVEMQLRVKVEDLQDQIKDLEKQRDKLLEDNKTTQLRNTKMIKKLKEYKVQVDSLQQQLKIQKSASDFYELDSAIEEELKSQISKLEKTLNDIKEEQKSTVAEKEALMKRLDIVVSANERYMEMKERQDMDVEVLRIRNKELSDKVEVLEKRIQGGTENIDPSEETQVVAPSRQKRSSSQEHFEVMCNKYKDEIDDLKDEMEALATENEQLQHFLEEQKIKLLNIESKRTAEGNESIEIVDDLNKKISELQSMLSKSREEYELLRKQYEQSLIDANDQVTVMRQNATLLKEEAIVKTSKLEMEIVDLRQQIEASELNVTELQRSLQNVLQEKVNLEERLSAVMISSENQLSSVNTTMAEVTDLLNIRIQEVADLKQELQKQYVTREEENTKWQDTIDGLNHELNEKQQELESLKKSLKEMENEFIQQQNIQTTSGLVSQYTQEQVQKHAVQVEEKEKEIERLNERLSALESTVNEYSLEIQNNVAQLRSQYQELDLLKQQLMEKDLFIESTHSNLNLTSEELAKKESQLWESKEQIEKLFKENEKHTETIGELHKRIKELEVTSCNVNEYDLRIQNLEQEIQRLSTLLVEKESALQQNLQESAQYRVTLENNNIEIRELHTKLENVEDLKRQLSEKTEQLNSVGAELETIRKVLEETKHTLDEKQIELERSINMQQDHRQQSSNIVNGFPLFRMGNDSNNLQHTIDTMQIELENRQVEIDHLKYILNENTYPSIIQEMQKRIDCLYNEKAELESSLEMANVRADEREKQIAVLMQSMELQNQEFVTKEEANLSSRENRSIQDQQQIVKLQNELHTKEQEINELKYIITEKESQLCLHAGTEAQSDDFELRETVQRLTVELHGKEQEIQDLKSTIEELRKEISRLQEFEILSEETKGAIQRLNMEKEQVRLQAEEFLETKLKEKEMEIDEIKQKLSMENQRILHELQLKDTDVQNLRKQLEEAAQIERTRKDELRRKDDEFIRVNSELAEKERRLAELSITKDTELHNLRVQIHEKEVRIEELLALSDEEEKQLKELRNTLDARETEINSLKTLLEDKVKEYEMIQNVLKKDVPVMGPSEVRSAEAPEDDAKVSQELSLALYMLHQRDVRCEELTQELMQLLEERDTLQLRLSNAIRVNEELRKTSAPTSSDFNPDKETTSPGTDEPIVEHPSPSKSEGPVEIAKEAIDAPIGEDKETLALKLSQLHTVSHAKDVRLRDERELRYTQQMSLLAHKDVLSTLPPEAAARLVNANYTLSRDVQSQSSVLLNWLWGKSTPKVVHM